MDTQTVGAQSSLPDWLTPSASQSVTPLPAPQSPKVLTRELMLVQFESMFERVLTEITRGQTLKSIISNDARNIDYDAFWQWIKKDPRRVQRYKEAKELRTEWWAGRMIEIAEGGDTTEDVQRSKLQIDTYKWLMQADNRKTYGESRQVELSTSISITAALEQANARMLNVIDMVDAPALTHQDEDSES
jgi:hypothetical protein